jgi:two-component system chemotaxis sensor kinase CheA
VATVRLAASHRGNNVFITVEDDGGGIDTGRVRQIAVQRGIVAADVAEALGERELVELIFQPGFSPAARVSDISGRGVGMDIVRTRIAALNGTIEVETEAGRGTRFTIRLPLTLTITRCMLFGLPQGVLAIPIENVREITSVARHPRMTVEGREVCDVRGEFLPVVGIEEIFSWPAAGERSPTRADLPNIAILHANNRVLGLRVDTLLGGQDIVVKPLDENFVHVRGLGGASVLGDGTVCMPSSCMKGPSVAKPTGPAACPVNSSAARTTGAMASASSRCRLTSASCRAPSMIRETLARNSASPPARA